MFEATTALALDHFAREAVDIAVLEVGLGGRLDATTVGAPAVTAVTRVDLDHQEVLGATLAAIAAEKAAIIRSGVAIASTQAPEAAQVLCARAEAVGVPLLTEGRELSVRVHARDRSEQLIDCAGPGWRLEGLRLPLLGLYQPSNALVALAAARALGVPDSAAREGLARARWPGRFEILRARDRTVVLDGAHNPAGAQALAASLAEWFGDTPGPYQHFRQAQIRAVENGLPLLRAANNGISAVVDPRGRIVDALAIDARGAARGATRRDRRRARRLRRGRARARRARAADPYPLYRRLLVATGRRAPHRDG